ncbi:hypothetical protein ElyMa_000464400 [Elysia marginata]|uniref:Uncharacterized protein n=1 Tax=Elysia marginata TaxID=1093978 RepID=A0AAV4FR03_9GAST|nr:hypothetical protein ElyMa_000464400 [Elysia marginata]
MFNDVSRLHRILRTSPKLTRSARVSSLNASDPGPAAIAGSDHHHQQQQQQQQQQQNFTEDSTHHGHRRDESHLLSNCASPAHSGSTNSSPTHSGHARTSPVHFGSSSHSSSAAARSPQRARKTAPPLRNSKYVHSVLYGTSPVSDDVETAANGRQLQQKDRPSKKQQPQQARPKMQLDPRVLMESSSQHAPPLIYVESCLLGV